MEYIDITLPLSGSIVPVTVIRKNMKTCRLKVYPDRKIVLSMPKNVSTEWAENFINKHAMWMDKKLEEFKKTAKYEPALEVKDGASVKMLGEDMIFSVSEGSKNRIHRDNNIIYIKCTDANAQDKLVGQFDKWWRNQAFEIFDQRVDHWYHIIEQYGIPRPCISVRRMRTMWGSCSVGKNKVTFNFYLLKARMACIDYVVLHELVHFIHPNHSRQFYDFLSVYMPDWKVRKTALDNEVSCAL